MLRGNPNKRIHRINGDLELGLKSITKYRDSSAIIMPFLSILLEEKLKMHEKNPLDHPWGKIGTYMRFWYPYN